jgi:hypothetical protein
MSETDALAGIGGRVMTDSLALKQAGSLSAGHQWTLAIWRGVNGQPERANGELLGHWINWTAEPSAQVGTSLGPIVARPLGA